jgi:hypothetical protein
MQKNEVINVRMELERQLLLMSGKLKQTEAQVDVERNKAEQEEKLKEEYHKQFQRVKFDLDKISDRHNAEKVALQQ